MSTHASSQLSSRGKLGILQYEDTACARHVVVVAGRHYAEHRRATTTRSLHSITLSSSESAHICIYVLTQHSHGQESMHHAMPARGRNALTTPPASRLGLPNAQRSARGRCVDSVRRTNVRRRERARRGGRARRRDRHVRGQHPRAGGGLPGADVAVLRAAGRVITRPSAANVFASKDAARVSSSIALASGTTLLALALAVVAGRPSRTASNSSRIPCLSRRRSHSRPRVPLKKTLSSSSAAMSWSWRRIAVLRKRTATLGRSRRSTEGPASSVYWWARRSSSARSIRWVYLTRSRRRLISSGRYVASASPSCSRRRSPSCGGRQGGELTDNSSRALNAALGLASWFVGGRRPAPGGEGDAPVRGVRSVVGHREGRGLGDVGRSVTNTDAAFLVRAVVRLVLVLGAGGVALGAAGAERGYMQIPLDQSSRDTARGPLRVATASRMSLAWRRRFGRHRVTGLIPAPGSLFPAASNKQIRVVAVMRVFSFSSRR